MLCSEGIGFVQRLSSQHEGDRIVVRCIDAAVYAARTRSQWSANERPINPAPPFEKAARGSGWSVQGRRCILKSSLRNGERHCFFRSVQVEVTCNNNGAVSVPAGRIRQDL